MAGIHKLSAPKVAKLNEPGRYADGGGLYLQVSKWNGETVTKAWLFRYMLNGKPRSMGLGAVHTLSLADAREKARQARALLLEGIDPIDAREGQRREARAQVAKQVSFREAAEKYIAAHRAGWKNEKHGAQYTATLATYAYPILGGLSVAAIDTSHVMKVLEPIWETKTETASRIRGRIEAILDWASARKFRQGENPARWQGQLKHLLPAKAKVSKVKHHDALPYGEVPAFMAKLRDHSSVSAKALEFTILTAARTGETIGARWSEIDFAAKVWTVPAERMKSAREHRVPLSDRALAILADMPREGDADGPIFPGVRPGKGLSNMAMLQLVRGMTDNGYTVHGFRSSFRDWAGEQSSYPREVIEAALAHIVSDKTEAAYARGTLFDKRRRLLVAWAGYCSQAPRAGKVLPLREARA